MRKELALARLNAGNKRPARIAMIAITTKSSISVKPTPHSSPLSACRRVHAFQTHLSKVVVIFIRFQLATNHPTGLH